jgi:hypothetical protein
MVLLFAVHSRSGIIDFLSSVPSFVREYSTRGGISAKDSRVIRPSFWRSFNVSESVFGLMPCRVSIILLNLSFPWLPNVLIIRSAHFLLITSIMPFRGQRHVWGFLGGMGFTFLGYSDYFTINLIV